MTTATITDYPGLIELLDRLSWMTERIAEYKRESDGIKEVLRRHFGCVDHVRIGHHSLTIRPTMRFDAQLALTVLTPEEIETVSIALPSSSRARLMLPPERYALCQRQSGEHTVRLS